MAKLRAQLIERGAAIAAATEIVDAAGNGGDVVRLLGGVAVALRCPIAARRPPLVRQYSDVDLAASRASTIVLQDLLPGLGYQPRSRFNALHGRKRLMFDRSDSLHLDVFVDELAMCHRLPLADRLEIDALTIPLADLALAKLQVAELAAKDVADLTALLLEYGLSPDERGINASYIADLLSRDWGWWRTVVANLQALTRRLDKRLSGEERAAVADSVDRLLLKVSQTPKTLRWRARSRLGDRVSWREEPEAG